MIRPPFPSRYYCYLASVLACRMLDRGRTFERYVSVLLDIRYYWSVIYDFSIR